ncbi:class A beta-lactamase-related serine hydrolase [Kitasatospora purpeofusca]|nr:class A beta-lactamase-related serine hydrolase [Kitasatospora purpeofusca]
MLDDARLSLRDLAYLTAAVSDNTAADTLWDQIGLETVNRTVAVHTLRDLIAAIAEDTGPDSPVDPAVVARLRVLDPSFTNHSTPPRGLPGLHASKGGALLAEQNPQALVADVVDHPSATTKSAAWPSSRSSTAGRARTGRTSRSS